MRALGLGTVLIALVVVLALLDEETGIEIWMDLRASLGVSSARVALLERENEALQSELEILEADPSALDRAIREELDLALPGEVVVHFRGPDSAASPGLP